MKQLPTYEEVNELLEYNSETGLFRWKNPRGSRCKKGWFTGSSSKIGYNTIYFNGNRHYAHRLAWLLHTGEWPFKNIDHIDGCKSNNAISNLRDVSQSDNLRNLKHAKGWSKHRNRYRAQIRLDSINSTLGIYDTPEEAAIAYWSVKNILGLNPNYEGPTYA